MYSFEQVKEAAVKYFNGNELAADVWVNKYALQDNDKNFHELTPDDMHHRLAKEFARIEAKYPNSLSEETIYNLFKNFEYIIPQGSPMSAVGNNFRIESTSSCIVIDSPYDSYGGIMYTDQELAQLMKRRCGVGFAIETLRPDKTPTTNAAKTSTGLGSFMKRYSNTTREVGQDNRRGALMLCCDITHPESEIFTEIKRDRKNVTGANISLKLRDAFLQAVLDGTSFQQQFPVDSLNPLIVKDIDAKQLWNKIIDAAWESAEPGLLFWDTFLRNTPSDAYDKYRTIGTNPCSEIGMCPNDSCRLLILNLFSYVKNPYTKDAKFDYRLFYEHTIIAQRLMDDLVDLEIEQINKILAKIESDPEPEHIKTVERGVWLKLRKTAIAIRRTGLGITALGDTLAALGLVYGSEESIDETEYLYRCLEAAAYHSSIQMAKERGCFPAFNFETEMKNEFLLKVFDSLHYSRKLDWRTYGRRNIALTTTAPVGSASLLCKILHYFGTTSGIEPVFKVKSRRRRKLNEVTENVRVDFTDELGDNWQEYDVYHNGYKLFLELGNIEDGNSVYLQSESDKINWEARVDLQAAAQKWVDHAISSTINLPKDVSKEIVAAVYMRAWQKGCKGITVYRDGSRDGVLLTEEDTKQLELKQVDAPKRPELLKAKKTTVKAQGISCEIFVSELDNKPFEVFAVLEPIEGEEFFIKKHKRKDKARYSLLDKEHKVLSDINAVSDPSLAAITRLVSLNLRHGTPVQYVVEQLEKAKTTWFSSFPALLGRVLKTYIKDGTKGSKCPECGNDLVYQEGCLLCYNCGHSKCG